MDRRHVPAREVAPASGYDHEWTALRVRGLRRRQWNFEQECEPHAGPRRPDV